MSSHKDRPKLEFTREGIPLYDGDPDLLEEYTDRAKNLLEIVKLSKDAETRTKTIALELRNGLRGDAYDYTKRLSIPELAKPEGVTLLLESISIRCISITASTCGRFI